MTKYMNNSKLRNFYCFGIFADSTKICSSICKAITVRCKNNVHKDNFLHLNGVIVITLDGWHSQAHGGFMVHSSRNLIDEFSGFLKCRIVSISAPSAFIKVAEGG